MEFIEKPSFESVAKREKPKSLSPALPQPVPPTTDPVSSSNKHIVEAVKFEAVTAINPVAFYTLTTYDKDSLLCANDSGTGDSYQWAFLGSKSYLNNSVQVMFSNDPTVSPAKVILLYKGTKKFLFANGKATSWEYCFFGTSAYSDSYPLLELSAVTTPGGFKLQWKNGDTIMNLCPSSGGSSFEYLYVGKEGDYTNAEFLITRSYLTAEDTIKAFKSEWPDSFNVNEFKSLDSHYDLIPSTVAKTIYKDSGLSGYDYKKQIFDCDDFAWIYKAQVSKYVYSNNNAYPYAVIFLTGKNRNGGHAVNAYIDGQGNIIVLEPQSGSIVAGRDWKDGFGVLWNPMWAIL